MPVPRHDRVRTASTAPDIPAPPPLRRVGPAAARAGGPGPRHGPRGPPSLERGATGWARAITSPARRRKGASPLAQAPCGLGQADSEAGRGGDTGHFGATCRGRRRRAVAPAPPHTARLGQGSASRAGARRRERVPGPWLPICLPRMRRPRGTGPAVTWQRPTRLPCHQAARPSHVLSGCPGPVRGGQSGGNVTRPKPLHAQKRSLRP